MQVINISKKNWKGVLQTTSESKWAYHSIIPLREFTKNKKKVLLINILVENGSLGILLDSKDEISISKEIILLEGNNEIELNLIDKNLDAIIRNINKKGSSTFMINEIRLLNQESIILKENIQKEINTMFVSKNDEYKKLLSKKYNFHPSQIDKITIPKDIEVEINLGEIFNSEKGKVIYQSISSLIEKLYLVDTSKLSKNQGDFDKSYFTKYLRQTIIRIFHLIKMFEERGIKNAKILDIGTLLGSFAIPLQKLGHEVVAVDRFSSYDGSLDPLMKTMKEEGIKIVNVNEANESKMLSELGVFDVVISMAVIEHIPHTPRFFLENLKKRVRPNGWFVIDTPNITRFWNRQLINNDKPVMQDIKFQYFCDIPFEGHHREFTKEELLWMFKECGYSNIEAIRFDYNLLQFEKLTSEHLFSLFAMQVDPSLMDTIMVIGQNLKESRK